MNRLEVSRWTCSLHSQIFSLTHFIIVLFQQQFTIRRWILRSERRQKWDIFTRVKLKFPKKFFARIEFHRESVWWHKNALWVGIIYCKYNKLNASEKKLWLNADDDQQCSWIQIKKNERNMKIIYNSRAIKTRWDRGRAIN